MGTLPRLQLPTRPHCPPHSLPPAHPLYTQFVILQELKKKLSQKPAAFK